MPTYISLVSWTEKGIGAFKDSVNRADAANALMGKFGGRMKDIYWTLGPYDIVVVSEAPDDESATAFALELGAMGNVRTTTMRAFDSGEMRAILAKTG
jgi:uncharacterized protein with GYD domain